MKFYSFGCVLPLVFAFAPDCAKSRVETAKIVPAVSATPPIVRPTQIQTAAAPPISGDSQLIWRGESGNFAVQWTKNDVRATDKIRGTEVFSARKTAAQRLKTIYSQNFDKKGKPNFENFTFGYKIAAFFGDLLFLKESTVSGPQTYTTETFLVIDLRNPKMIVSLKNFYGENEILQALLNNAEIKKDLVENDVAFPPTLSKFYPLFYTNAAHTTEGTERLFDRCWFPKNILETFTIEKIENGQVGIILGMPCRAGMREDAVYPLKLSFPANEKLKNRITDGEQIEKNQTQFAALTEETNISFDAASLNGQSRHR